MEPVSIPVRVSWQSMMAAKLGNAFRPSRLILFVVASCGLGTGFAVKTNLSILGSTVALMGAVVLLRLVVMASSTALDGSARRRFNGTLTLATEGLELKPRDGTSEIHSWSWVLSARITGGVLKLRVDERGGRVWLLLSLAKLAERGSVEQVRAHLRGAGKIEA